MPAAMASVLLMPLGLEALPLKLMGLGLSAVMLISDWVASWPGAGLRLPRLGVIEAALLSVALAILLLPQTRLRWASLPVFALAIAWLLLPRAGTVLLVDERAGNVALMTTDGLVPAVPRQASRSLSRWLAQAGDDAGVKAATQREGWTCTAQSCDAQSGPMRIVFLRKTAQPLPPCPQADILVSQEPLRRRCKGRLATIDRFDVWRNGAYAVATDGTLTHARGGQGVRPWVYEARARSKQ
jgi:competence protein ComEC